MEEIIEEILNATSKEEMKNIFDRLIKLIENMKEEEKEIFFNLLIAKAKYKQIKLEKENSFLDSNIFIYEKDISIKAAIIEELIVDAEDNEDLEETIKYLKNKYLSKKEKKNHSKEIMPKTVKDLITILQKEYKLVDIINASGTKLSIIFLDEETKNDMEVVNYNVIKNNKFALHIYRMKGKKEVFSILEQFGSIINQMLVGDSQRVPDSFIEFCRQRGIELDEESKMCISVFTELFALASIMKLEKAEQKGELEVIEYYDNLIGELYHRVCEKDRKIEWNDNEKCPCRKWQEIFKML